VVNLSSQSDLSRHLEEPSHLTSIIIKLAYKTKDAKELGKPIHTVKPLLEELIRKVKKIRQDTAYKIQKKRVGAIPWTPTLQLICNKQKLWVCIIKHRQGKKTSRNKLSRLQKATKIWSLDNISLQEALDNLTDVKAEHSEYIKDAAKLRKEYLEALAEAITKENDTTMLTELNNLKLREKQRNTARRIKRLRKNQRSGKVTIMHRTIHRPNQPPLRVACTTQVTMTEAAICENESCFSRALVGKFMQPPLRDMLGNLGNKELSTSQILDGTFQCPDTLVNPYAKLLLQVLSIPTHVKRLTNEDIGWTEKELSKSWQHCNSKTASESTNLNFSHHIAGTYNQQVLEVDCIMCTVPFEMGFSPSECDIMEDFKLFKQMGVTDVEEMRTIRLMVAAYNMNNKRLRRLTMQQAEKYNLIPKEQYGSRKRHKAINYLLNKVLIWDTSRQLCLSMAYLCNDAEKFYNYMIHNVTSLGMQCTGMTHQPITAMLTCLQESSTHILTAYGTSKEWYGGKKRKHERELPLMGAGQGNGAAPTAYGLLSAAIIKVMALLGFGAVFATAISLQTISVICSMFVDNCDLWQSATSTTETGEDIAPQMQNRCLGRMPSCHRWSPLPKEVMLVPS